MITWPPANEGSAGRGETEATAMVGMECDAGNGAEANNGSEDTDAIWEASPPAG